MKIETVIKIKLKQIFQKFFVKVLFYTPENYIIIEKILEIKNLVLRKFLRMLADSMTHNENPHENFAGFKDTQLRINVRSFLEVLF